MAQTKLTPGKEGPACYTGGNLSHAFRFRCSLMDVKYPSQLTQSDNVGNTLLIMSSPPLGKCLMIAEKPSELTKSFWWTIDGDTNHNHFLPVYVCNTVESP